MAQAAARTRRPQPTALTDAKPAKPSRLSASLLSLKSPSVQPKLTVNTPGDRYEQEADAVASAVMHTPAPLPQPDANRGSIQRMAEDDDQDVLQRLSSEEELLQRKGEGSPRVSPSTAATIRNPGSGAPLSPGIRHRVEPHVGANLSGVRVHTGPTAHRAAASLNARAFTHGSHIFLNRSESSHNLGLMAHESTHVVQQRAAPIQRQPLEETASSLQRAPALSFAVPSIQRIGLDDLPGIDVDALARRIPGYLFFSVMVGYDILRDRDVVFNAINVMEGLMGLAGPVGIAVFDALQEYEVLQSAFDWTSRELRQRDLTVDRIQRTIDSIDIGLEDALEGLDYVVGELRRHFQPLYDDAIAFVDSLIDHIIELIKEAAIAFAEPLLAENRAWALIKKILHYDPLRDEEVEASTVEILEDFLLLIGKDQELEQMRERGTLQETADWLDTQLALFTSLLGQLRGIVTDAWNAIQPENLPNLGSNLENLAGRVVGFLEGVWTFASTVALTVLELIKNALLGWLSTYANDIPGYHLLTVLLEKDPFTQEAVPRNATNLIRGFISLIPGGEQQFQQMQETGVIPQAAQRIEGLMTELGITWPFVQQLFLDIWNAFTIEDLLNPIDAFIRVLQRFEEPLTRLFTFVIEVIKVVLELVLVLMNFPTDLIGSIIANAMQAFEDIQRDPVGFLINLLETAKLGFQKFFDNIFENLLGGLTDWLFSAVREAGIEPPADFSFESVLGFVLDVLGLTMDHMWELLADHIGQERVDQIRGAIDRVMEIAREAWGFIQDVQERGMVAVWEYIESQLTNLWDIVLQQVQDYVMERVINVGMRWLMSLLDATGITPVINSFVAFFNAIQSAIQYLREMLEVVNDFVSTVASIARGDIEPGATRMEQGLKNSIPILIGFIANQLGLGDLGQRLGEIIESIRGVVDQALNWLIEQALRIGGAILSQLGFGREPSGTETSTTDEGGIEELVRQAVLSHLGEREHTRENVQSVVEEVEIEMHSQGVRKMEVSAPEEDGGYDLLVEASPLRPFLRMVPLTRRGSMRSAIRVSVDQSGPNLSWSDMRGLDAPGRQLNPATGQLEDIQSPFRYITPPGGEQTARGAAIVLPQASRTVHVVSRATGDYTVTAAASHAEKYFTRWIENQSWKNRITEITIENFHLNPCTYCGGALVELLNHLNRNRNMDNKVQASLSWSLPWGEEDLSTIEETLSHMQGAGWVVNPSSVNRTAYDEAYNQSVARASRRGSRR